MPNTAHTAGTRLPLRPLPALVAALALAAWPLPLTAAPLDEFLTAMPGYEPMHGEAEASFDIMNSTVDLFGVRDSDSSIGDYSGGTVRGGLALTRRLWVDGTLQRRSVKTRWGQGDSNAWKMGAQYQATVNTGYLPAIALRLSAWGDFADEAYKGSPTSVGGITANSVRVDAPRDMQTQMDLIGTWRMNPQTSLSMFFGFGNSSVKSDGITVDSFNLDGIGRPGKWNVSTQSATDDNGKPITRIKGACFSDCGSLIAFDVPLEDLAKDYPQLASASSKLDLFERIDYDAKYFQLGGMFQWFNEDWRTRIGYRYQTLDRDVDDAIRSSKTFADATVYDSNHVLSADVGYKLQDHLGFFLRGNLMSNQFVGELPFSYNYFSSHKFKEKYGFLSIGLASGF